MVVLISDNLMRGKCVCGFFVGVGIAIGIDGLIHDDTDSDTDPDTDWGNQPQAQFPAKLDFASGGSGILNFRKTLIMVFPRYHNIK